jgi:hypothetical protein
MHSKTLLIGVIIGVLLSTTGIVLAGSLTPSVGPAGAASQMYTLEQIYSRLNTSAAATKMTAFTEPSTGPGSTMHTLDDIYALALPARVPKTGQNAIYHADDGGVLKKGVTWPNPRFTDNGDSTVTDNLTGLIWLKNANCANAVRNWMTAFADLYSLNNTGYMNNHPCSPPQITDWRLPNVRELQSLIHYGFGGPALPNTAGIGQWTAGNPFNGVQSNYYWTSNSVDADVAWVIGLGVGNVTIADKLATYYVWPVRGGQ